MNAQTLEFRLNQINKRIDVLTETDLTIPEFQEFQALIKERAQLTESLKTENRRLLNKWVG